MFGKRASNNPGLCPVKGQNSGLCSQTGAQNRFSSLSLLLQLCHITKCWLSTQPFVFLFMFCLETPKDVSGPANFCTEPSLMSLLVISFPHTPACPGAQYSPTVCQVELSFNAFWHCHTNGHIVLAA